jgi:hypothetical protein
VPADTPETTPVEETDATLLLLLLHVPPPTPFAKVVVNPLHALFMPVIACDVLTVIAFVALHPVPIA